MQLTTFILVLPFVFKAYDSEDNVIMLSAALFLEAASPDIIDDNRHVRTNSGSSVQIGCSGSGALSWSTSSGVHISVERALQPTNSLYQTSDPSNNLQTLFIQNFSHSDVARYTCRTNLTADGMSIAESVFITNCK